jgi:mannose-1-phosphate guanylyltransferase
MLHSVIMAGGSGTRFWPLSRQACPKQFLALGSERSLIQQAFDRCQPAIPAERCWVVTNARLAGLTAEHLPEIPAHQILQEPAARNTAPCVALAALCLLEVDPEAVMLVMPADHVIGPTEEFQSAVQRGASLIADDPQRLVLFGVPPTYPSTGYGYLQRGAAIAGQSGSYDVLAFKEKPSREIAEQYLRDGRYFWNCGIFLWRAERILEALAKHEPELLATVSRLRPHWQQPSWQAALAEHFPQAKSISIDYAVLEREAKIAVVEATFDWDDVGAWLALERLHPQDSQGNTIVGLHRGVGTHNCIIRSSPEHLIATIGVRDSIIVHTPDATLVASRDDENAIRELIQLLQQTGTAHYL